MKNKLTVFTHQDALEQVAPRMRGIFVDGIKDFPGIKNPYVEAVKNLEDLPRPLRAKDVHNILKEAGFPANWWKDQDWRPVCEFCGEPQDWVLVAHDLYECANDYDESVTFDVNICESCINELRAQVFDHYSSTGPKE